MESQTNNRHIKYSTLRVFRLSKSGHQTKNNLCSTLRVFRLKHVTIDNNTIGN